jgi:predicted aldo/keto reductase-like oxidoreductase
MKLIQLGNTGIAISELGFGGIPILRLPAATAVGILHHAYERGITFYDTANAYRDSEAKIGQAFAGMRERVVIATKTTMRDEAGALAHLENSLKMLRTDYIDLYQLHQIAREEDWENVTAPGGALAAIAKAKAQGQIRFIGVTSHSLPMAVKLVKTGLFSTIQFPFNFIESAPQDELFIAARELGVGIIAMKPFAGGVIDNAAVSFKFLRQFPDVIPIPGFDAEHQIDEVVSFYDHPNTVTEADRQMMDKYRTELGQAFCRRCEYCRPCPNGVLITPAMGYKVLAGRMSPAIAVQFGAAPMESIKQCNHCGICITRCPYNLSIPDILQRHYETYQTHKAQFNNQS